MRRLEAGRECRAVMCSDVIVSAVVKDSCWPLGSVQFWHVIRCGVMSLACAVFCCVV